MKKDYADITIVLDRSGSMGSCVNDVIGGFNTFIDEQKKVPGKATVNLYQFDDHYDVVYENKDINDVPQLTTETFIPRGLTALLDAVGKTIVSIGERYSKMDESERPEKVFFVVITDGAENASKEYFSDKIQEMIKLQKETYSWIFVFLGADITAIDLAQTVGISHGNTMNYAHTNAGYHKLYKSVAKNITKMRDSSVTAFAAANDMEFFDAEDRADQEEELAKSRK